MTYLEAVRYGHRGRGGLYKSAASDFYRMNNKAIGDRIYNMYRYVDPVTDTMNKFRISTGKNPAKLSAIGFLELLGMTEAARMGYKPSASGVDYTALIRTANKYNDPSLLYNILQEKAEHDRSYAEEDALYDHIRRVQAQQDAEASAAKPTENKPFNVRNYMGRAVGTTAGGAIGALAGNSLRNKILLGALGGGTGYLAGDYYDRGSNSLIGRGASKLVSLFKSDRDKLLENKLNK